MIEVVYRMAENAEAAIEALCDQYGWGMHVNMVDADTRGIEWAKCGIDDEGGINYCFSAFAEKVSNGSD